MRRDEMYMGMTIIFKSLQEKAFNFQDYRSEGPDSLLSPAGLGQPLGAGGKPSTWLPPGGLVEQEFSFIFLIIIIKIHLYIHIYHLGCQINHSKDFQKSHHFSSFFGSRPANLSANCSRHSEFSQLCHYRQKMRRDEMYLGMTIIFKSLQEKVFNFLVVD